MHYDSSQRPARQTISKQIKIPPRAARCEGGSELRVITAEPRRISQGFRRYKDDAKGLPLGVRPALPG